MQRKDKTIDIHIPSILGYEKVAMESAAAVAKIIGFRQNKIDDLKTAVSEACINAMEHGNRLKKDTMVLVTLNLGKKSLEVNIADRGKGVQRQVKPPKIENQINGSANTRGWGMFLIKNLVDELEFKKMPKGGSMTRMVIHVNRQEGC